jgi:hypothetical protein
VWCDPFDFLCGQRDAFGIVGQNQVNKHKRRIRSVSGIDELFVQVFDLAFEFRNALLEAFRIRHGIFPFVRLACTPNDACNRDVRKALVAGTNAAGVGERLAEDTTDGGAGDLHAAPTTPPCGTWARDGKCDYAPLFQGAVA